MKKTQEQFEKEVLDKLGKDYTVTGTYTGNKNPIEIVHNVCKTHYFTAPINILYKGWKCKNCYGVPLTTERFQKKLDSIFGKNEYTVVGTYTGVHHKVMVRHNKCNRTWEANPQTLLRGCQCKMCVAKMVGKEQSRSTDEFKSILKEKRGTDYVLESEYVNSLTKVKVKHLPCNNEYWIRPDSLLRGSSCTFCLAKRCSTSYLKTTAQYSKEVKSLTRGEYQLISEYKGVNEYVTIKHNICGNTYQVYPYLFNRGRRCPKCSSMPTGEMIIENFLIKNNIKYTCQVKFKDCLDINQLSYDFLLVDFNTLIEYQGVQHYKPIDLFGGKSSFITQIRHDCIKKKYARDNGYILFEISYKRSSPQAINKALETYLNYVKQRFLNLN